MICNNFCGSRCRNVSLAILKTSSVTGAGLPGAVFELTCCNGCTCNEVTNSRGLILLTLQPCTTYTLREIIPPAGYAATDTVYNIVVDGCGEIFVNGSPTSQMIISNTPFSAFFTAIKVNVQTGAPLAGAVYGLYQGELQIASTVSDKAGHVTFGKVAAGTYRLAEITPPAGFQTNTESLTVVVAQDGTTTINGQPADGFILNNTPLDEFSFLKLDASTGLPLPGATFSLSYNGVVLGSVVSGADGVVHFGILTAGTYELAETIPPAGYQPNTAIYQVVVSPDGSITVDGAPFDTFTVMNNPITISAPPVINTIYEGSPFINGMGIPGSEIAVLLPDGSTVTTVVGPTGMWTVNVPVGMELIPGNIISATQTEPGKMVSPPVISMVIAAVEPFLDKTVENHTTPGGAIGPGDELLYTILVGNLGGIGSVWSNVVLTDILIPQLTFQPGTVTLDGLLIPQGTNPGQYTYDSATQTLTLYVGDLTSGQVKAMAFHATVNLDATGEITNTVFASRTTGSAPTLASAAPISAVAKRK